MVCFYDDEKASVNSVRLYEKSEYLNKKHYCLEFPNRGKIVFDFPLYSIQIIFYDISSSKLPDLYNLGFKRITGERCLRAFICRNGSCEFTLNGNKDKLYAGQAMFDYFFDEHGKLNFTSNYFQGVEITIQLNAFDEDVSAKEIYQPIMKALKLSEKEFILNRSFISRYSSDTEKILDMFIESGFESEGDIVMIAYLVVLGRNLSVDLQSETTDLADNQTIIAKDIYDSLTSEFNKKWTAKHFADKYHLGESTVKRYFKKIYSYGFKEYQTKIRMDYAAKMLTTTDIQICDISDRVGFSDYRMFSNAFKKHFGCTPSDYRINSEIKS